MVAEDERELAKSICGTEHTRQQMGSPTHAEMTLCINFGVIHNAEAEIDK